MGCPWCCGWPPPPPPPPPSSRSSRSSRTEMLRPPMFVLDMVPMARRASSGRSNSTMPQPLDVPGSREVVLEVLPRALPGQVAHVAAPADEDLAAVRPGHAHRALPGLEAPALPRAGRGAGAAAAAAAALQLEIFPVLAHEDQAALELRVVQGLDGRRRLLRGLKLDNAAALARHHVGVHDVARLLEMVLQELPVRPERQVPDEHPPGDADRPAVV